MIRITRGCHWNRCRFCGIYPHLGQSSYSIRSFAEIKEDIDLLQQKRPQIETLFIGDADPLHGDIELFFDVLTYLKSRFVLQRITSYARFSTLHKLGPDILKKFASAGLTRVHCGLESGDDQTLQYHQKGHNRKIVQAAAGWLKDSGIEMSVYVLLGIGGHDRWQEHIRQTADLLNEIEPKFIRIRRLWIYPETGSTGPACPLTKEILTGHFIEQTPEGTILELQQLVQQLKEMDALFTCDHHNNYLNITGNLQEDRVDMLAEINAFLALPQAARDAHYSKVNSGI